MADKAHNSPFMKPHLNWLDPDFYLNPQQVADSHRDQLPKDVWCEFPFIKIHT